LAFDLDPRLAAGSDPLAALALCDLRLQLDARYPWLILIPRRRGVCDLDDLDDGDGAALTQEIRTTARALRRACAALSVRPDKLNVAALGNIVPQLHVHVLVRRVGDPAWPEAVWGRGSPEAYRPDQLQAFKAALHSGLGCEGVVL
jgi:diadenosine tetraphosphate (Ap4A) HIT family hydrolase